MDLQAQLRASLLSQSLPPPSIRLLTTLTTSRNPPLPLPSLLATARARLLASDLTSSASDDSLLDASQLAAFSPAASPPEKKVRLAHDVHVQVLDIELLSATRWDQVEELDADARGERTRGWQVVRVVDEEASQGQTGGVSAGSATSAAGNKATHRLVLQDHRGQCVYAVEVKRIEGIGIGKTHIGEKILLRAGIVLARGTALLVPEKCVLLGGRIEAWENAWTQDRRTRLRESLNMRTPT